MEPKVHNQDTEVTYHLPVKLSPRVRELKITLKKQKEILKFLAKSFNLTHAAASIGVSRQAVVKLMKSNELFAKAVDEVRDLWLDKSEDAGLYVSSQPTREGYNDRKLFLSAHRKEYQQKPEIQQNFLINSQDSQVHITQILQDHLPAQTVTVDNTKNNNDLSKVKAKDKSVP